MNKINAEYQRWLERANEDPDLTGELQRISGDADRIHDAFYRDLEFGTGGLRGLLGAGTNRMNIYTVAKASQGLSDYIKKHFPAESRKIAIGYDSRIKSDVFARTAAEVFIANGIRVYMYRELMPTPCLSFAVRELHCAAGVVVTASHNPAEYNGYKVYGPDGCQITSQAANDILAEIGKLDIFASPQRESFDSGYASGKIQYISDDVITDFVEAVKSQSVLGPADGADRSASIVYTPLNGSGLKPVLRVLQESGYCNITVAAEQEQPDGRFPTCPKPNPENREAMELGIQYARCCNAELLLATDPDCDRVGVAVKNDAGEFVLLSGNEVGILLFDYICSRRQANQTMPQEPLAVKTIVTTEMAESIAQRYGVRLVNVLTGFKYIGEQIGMLEAAGSENRYVFGFEESCGYLSGTYVRDKDGVNASFLICEMFSYYKANGVSLWSKLQELYREHGFYLTQLRSYSFTGAAGHQKMQQLMETLRKTKESFCGKTVLHCLDYLTGIDGLPKSNVLKFLLEDHSCIVIRPSGTEPKLKAYVSVKSEDRSHAADAAKQIAEALSGIILQN